MDIEQFLKGYIECALWSSPGPSDGPYACEFLDQIFDGTDISPSCLQSMRGDCEKFIRENTANLEEYAHLRRIECKANGWSVSSSAGHDFWLSRNGHGTGFFDRGREVVFQRLQAAARVWNEVNLYPGDDGTIYCS